MEPSARLRHLSPLRSAALGLLVLLPLSAPPLRAELAAGLRAGTTGAGPEVAFELTRLLDARLGTGFWSYDTTYDETGITYDGELELRNALLLLDWYPAGRGLRLSVGAGWNDNALLVSAPITELLRRERPDLPPLPPNLGRIHGEASGDSLAPYAGIGLGRPFGGGRWGVSLDLGVLYHGEPEVDLTVEPSPALPLPPQVVPVLAAFEAEEERRLAAELEDYRYLPVVALALTFRP